MSGRGGLIGLGIVTESLDAVGAGVGHLRVELGAGVAAALMLPILRPMPCRPM